MIKRILNLLLIVLLCIVSIAAIGWFLVSFIPDWLITGKTKYSLGICTKWFDYQEPIIDNIENKLFRNG